MQKFKYKMNKIFNKKKRKKIQLNKEKKLQIPDKRERKEWSTCECTRQAV
jgi:hypothetical protein